MKISGDSVQNRRYKEKYVNVITEDERRGANHIINAMGVHVAIMESRGYSVEECDRFVFKTLRSLERGTLDEGILDAVGGLFKWASNSKLLQPVQNWLGTKLASWLGLNPQGLLYKAVVNVIENMDVKTIQSMFSGKGNCRPVVAKIVGSLQEACIEQMLQTLGMAPTSFLGHATQETLLALFGEEGPIVDLISDKVCSFNISSFLPGSADKAEQIIAQAKSSLGSGVSQLASASGLTPPAATATGPLPSA